MKFLIVDDNPGMRQIIGQAVCVNGDTVIECSSGNEAVSCYESHKPDFVLMDIQMEGIDGIKTTQMIIEKFSNARIIIITDYDTPAFRSAAMNAGACGFVSKENLFDVKKYI